MHLSKSFEEIRKIWYFLHHQAARLIPPPFCCALLRRILIQITTVRSPVRLHSYRLLLSAWQSRHNSFSQPRKGSSSSFRRISMQRTKDSDRSMGTALMAVTLLFTTLSTIVVLLRTYIRILLKRNYGRDDTAIVIALVSPYIGALTSSDLF